MPFTPSLPRSNQSKSRLLSLTPELQDRITGSLPLTNLTSLAQSSQEAYNSTTRAAKVLTDKARKNIAERHVPLQKLVASHVRWLDWLTEFGQGRTHTQKIEDMQEVLLTNPQFRGWTRREHRGQHHTVFLTRVYEVLDDKKRGFRLELTFQLFTHAVKLSAVYAAVDGLDRPTIAEVLVNDTHPRSWQLFVAESVYNYPTNSWVPPDLSNAVALLYTLRRAAAANGARIRKRYSSDTLTIHMLQLVK